MNSAYKWVLLVLGFFFLLFCSNDGGWDSLGYAGALGMSTPSGSGVMPNNQMIPAKANANAVYYEPTIKNIINTDCARCHSGPTRNLMDYDSLKLYADTGLLATMVQGLMRRFAGNDAKTIVTWAQNGAPEKPVSGSGVPPNSQNMIPARANTKANSVYYEPTIEDIISTDCAQCHSGPTRNLMDYDSIKMYADTGLLAAMVQGPMQQFAGNDTQTIVTWAQNGAPEKSAMTRVFFSAGNCPPGQQPGSTALQGQDPVTYDNGVRQVLANDCLRCHSGPFRNLTTYKNVKLYVDNGLLKTLVSMGGPMHRFAGPDSRLIITWIDNGAPQ